MGKHRGDIKQNRINVTIDEVVEDEEMEEENNHRNTLYCLILEAACEPRDNIRKRASENLLRICSKNGGLNSLLPLFGVRNKKEIIQMIEIWTAIELQRMQASESDLNKNRKEEELDSAMSERKLALARTIQLLNSQCERRLAGERATVERLSSEEKVKLPDTSAMSAINATSGTELAGDGAAVEKLNSEERVELPDTSAVSAINATSGTELAGDRAAVEKLNSEGKVKSPHMRDIYGVLSQCPLDSNVDAGVDDNVTHVMHSQTSCMPLPSPSKPLSPMLPFPLNSSQSSSPSKASSLLFILIITLIFSSFMIMSNSNGPPTNLAAGGASALKWTRLGWSGAARVAFLPKLHATESGCDSSHTNLPAASPPLTNSLPTASSYGRTTTAREQRQFKNRSVSCCSDGRHTNDPPDEQGMKEAQGRIEELEEELEAERQSRSEAERQLSHLAREMEELVHRLIEAGGATAVQVELNKKRESEVGKLRKDLEESNIMHEATLVSLKKKQADSISEMSEQCDQLNKMKVKVAKDCAQIANEINDVRAATDEVGRPKASAEKSHRALTATLADLTKKIEEVTLNLGDFEASKRRYTSENADLLRQLQELSANASLMVKTKSALVAALEEQKCIADNEAKERVSLLGKFRNMEHMADGLRENYDEEAGAKENLARQLNKALGDADMWRQKYETILAMPVFWHHLLQPPFPYCEINILSILGTRLMVLPRRRNWRWQVPISCSVLKI